MRLFKTMLVLIVLIQILGCETTRVWSEPNRDQRYAVVIPQNDEDVEALLKKTGRTYYCQNTYGSTYPANTVCYVKVDESNLKVKLFETPKAIAIDVGNTILIVGEITIQLMANGAFGKGN